MTSSKATNSLRGLQLWEFAYSAFLRLLALFFLLFTFQIWIQAIGVSGDANFRFDTMETHWRFVVAAMCVLHPVTALGLWGLFPWGIAVWLIDVLLQMSMYLVFSTLFGFDQTLVIFHAVCFLIFIIFQLALRFTHNKQ